MQCGVVWGSTNMWSSLLFLQEFRILHRILEFEFKYLSPLLHPIRLHRFSIMASASTTPVKSIQLKEKVIAITGANRGIGLGIADCCLSNGAAKVYSIDIGDVGDEFNSLSSKFPGQLFALQADVTKEESIQAAVDKIVEEAGAIHGMVANAGRTKHKAALDFTTEEIDQLWGVNVSRRIQLSGIKVLTWCSCTAPSTRREWQREHSSNSASKAPSCSRRPWLRIDRTRYAPISLC